MSASSHGSDAVVIARHASSISESGGVDAGAPFATSVLRTGTGVSPWARVSQ